MTTLYTNHKAKEYRYIKLASTLESKIASGVYRAGEKLPSVRKLHKRTGLSITTVYQSLIELEKRGFVEARRKSGFYVKPRLTQILPSPTLKRHRPVAKKVSINAVAASIVEAMGDRRIMQLGGTVVAPQLLPHKELNRIVKTMTYKKLTDLMTLYENPTGNTDLRRQLARRCIDLLQGTGIDDIVITSGCIEAVSLCLQAVARPGDTILVESPTYPWFLQLIEDLKMLALELPTDPSSGIDIDSLKKTTRKHRVQAAILVPNFHNPLGFLMPDDKKKFIVSFMRKMKIPIIEDDIHGDLYFSGQRPATLKSFDRIGLVLYCNSFSKTVAPGLRIGWTIPGAFHDRVRQLKINTGIASPGITQHVVAEYLNGGSHERHLRNLRTILKNQVNNMALMVARYFPEGTRITAPKGGLMLWVEMGSGVDGLNVFHAAREQGIAILPGAMCSTTRRYNHCIRISCGSPVDEKIETAIKVLAEIVRNSSG
ncbi:MAG: PLP-dependent aminotransferase family protein [Deltaproteobacteria bacterium]|nr:PLP-dependent aminotransferase family protein [Deltaproteobacteria bacterium]MBW2611469.1 PLP-dependent aminotransferase family protein [Deltaproteobacteria bacterium]MBW2634381.1 PLP-dependent aminotransferase family protein [Deltaproteobacteria bacterium]MBW2678008.1 PLP-dependent aminotransferase family protein [Deltaproteobacteria bacterium]